MHLSNQEPHGIGAKRNRREGILEIGNAADFNFGHLGQVTPGCFDVQCAMKDKQAI